MLIGEISKITGFSKDALRYYERLGLYRASRSVRGRTEFRRYSEEDLALLLDIKALKQLGFTLKEIRALATAGEKGRLDCATASDLARRRIEKIEKEIGRLVSTRANLVEKLTGCSGDCRAALRT